LSFINVSRLKASLSLGISSVIRLLGNVGVFVLKVSVCLETIKKMGQINISCVEAFSKSRKDNFFEQMEMHLANV
jgi:hypothetical protein